MEHLFTFWRVGHVCALVGLDGRRSGECDPSEVSVNCHERRDGEFTRATIAEHNTAVAEMRARQRAQRQWKIRFEHWYTLMRSGIDSSSKHSH